jgi:hypothetical protein
MLSKESSNLKAKGERLKDKGESLSFIEVRERDGRRFIASLFF